MLSINPILIPTLPPSLDKLLSKFGFVAVISPVSVANKAKSDDLDLWRDLDLACDLLRFNSPKKYSSRAFDCCLARLARPSVRELGRVEEGGQNLPPPPSRARLAEYPGRARYERGHICMSFWAAYERGPLRLGPEAPSALY